jgi:hypothetical protein
VPPLGWDGRAGDRAADVLAESIAAPVALAVG